MSTKTYQLETFKKDAIIGTFRGMVFGFCWGTVQGAYHVYNDQLPFREFAKKWAKFTGRSMIGFIPMVIASTASYSYFHSLQIPESSAVILCVLTTTLCFPLTKRIVYPKLPPKST